ncbi:Endonuclease/exonuclease/phosphatase, partial [Sphaerosporella brunnea]
VAAAAETSGTFDILTYNIAGLPEPISGSNPSTNTPLISSRLNNFSIVHLQEDFAYHSELLSRSTHRYRSPFTGSVPFGSGLSTLSAFPLTDVQQHTWAACWVGTGDCLTRKGFSATRIHLAPGVDVDFYNLHSEAGDTELDFVARRAGWEQLSAFMNSYSRGNPVVLAGDTNTRYTSPKDPARLLLQKNGLRDIWVELYRGGVPPAADGKSIECAFPVPAGSERQDCEQIDKIQYRGNRLVELVPTAFVNRNADFVDARGGPLSDHFPNQAVFSWRISDTLRTGERIVGGRHSTYFNDADTPGAFGARVPVVTSLTLRGGSRLDAIRYTLSDGTVVYHGGRGGTDQTLTLREGEGVERVEVCVGTRAPPGRTLGIFSMEVWTDLGRRVRVGSGTGECFSFTPPEGGRKWGMAGFQGWKGSEVDALGVIWGK